MTSAGVPAGGAGRTETAAGGGPGGDLGPPARQACPDCGGVLNRDLNTDLLAFRCRVGHRWHGESLQAALDQQVEGALWMALRTLEDQIELDEQLLERARARDRSFAAERIERRLALRRGALKPLWRLLTDG